MKMNEEAIEGSKRPVSLEFSIKIFEWMVLDTWKIKAQKSTRKSLKLTL